MKKIFFLFFVIPFLSLGQSNTFPATGNVGIGVETPTGKLDIAGLTYLKGAPSYSVIAEQLRIGRRDQNIRYHSLYSFHGGAGHTNYLQFRVHTGNTEDLEEQVKVMTLNGDGNVGIGTEAPDHKLDVMGIIKSNTGIIVSNPDSRSSRVTLDWLNDVARIRIGGSGNGAGNGLDIQSQGDKSLMRLLQNGNVGIGTITPDSRLSVNGVVHSKEVKVDLNGWSDFVFKKDYALPTLEEVEQHILEKGHLRDIPSAEEVSENGILLGEMDAKLLQKIEELTLYIISLHKKMEQQQQEIDKLKNK
ncbi:hypothetical protein SAMN02927921_03275 [Sinomicrobium oceani]|uniref:Uncharacterized protein n=1 Tax=Sinomicrobium oceani TaxID=1150368 RepID=A0A1K1R7K5_9FLAO|nr:hypothetical protein [Sinomicrobium oceani]SFW68210.1 hypothetical protein SAMN02927921_03275 [Sinomicrobium oceani]